MQDLVRIDKYTLCVGHTNGDFFFTSLTLKSTTEGNLFKTERKGCFSPRATCSSDNKCTSCLTGQLFDGINSSVS